MSFGAGIFAFMSTGLSVGTRVYPLTLKQRGALPAMTYQVISDVPVVVHDDQQDHPAYTGTRYSVARVQFNCYGNTYDEAEALCDELLSLAVGYRGSWGAVEVSSVIPETRLDDWEEAPALYRVIQDLQIGHRTAASS